MPRSHFGGLSYSSHLEVENIKQWVSHHTAAGGALQISIRSRYAHLLAIDVGTCTFFRTISNHWSSLIRNAQLRKSEWNNDTHISILSGNQYPSIRRLDPLSLTKPPSAGVPSAPPSAWHLSHLRASPPWVSPPNFQWHLRSLTWTWWADSITWLSHGCPMIPRPSKAMAWLQVVILQQDISETRPGIFRKFCHNLPRSHCCSCVREVVPIVHR